MSSDLTQDISKIPIINVGRDMDDLLNKKTRKITSINNKSDVDTTDFYYPSTDSGLTIPINETTIRPWFNKI